MNFWKYDKNIQFETAENVLDFYNRVNNFFDELKKNMQVNMF